MMLGNLFSSLARAGDNLSGQNEFEPSEKGFSASIGLRYPMTESMKSAAVSYMRLYAKEAGWQISIRVQERHVRIEGKAASKPASRRSKNLKATACGSSK